MPAKKTLRLDQVVFVSAICLLVGFTFGLVSGHLIWRTPISTPGPATGPRPAVAPPSSPLGSFSVEIRELQSIVERDPDNYSAWVRLGNLLFDTDQYMDAIGAYTNALDIQSDDPNVITDRAIMYRRIGDFEQAAAEFRRAAELDPSHLNSALNLGVVLRYDLNDLPGAIQAWRMYLDRNPPAEMADKIRREIETLEAQGK